MEQKKTKKKTKKQNKTKQNKTKTGCFSYQSHKVLKNLYFVELRQ